MKLSTTPADATTNNDPFVEINRLFRLYNKGILSEYETMVMIAASATDRLRQHIMAVAQEEAK